MLHEDELHSFYNTLASHAETDTGKSLLGARMSYYEQAPHKAFSPPAVAFVASCTGSKQGKSRGWKVGRKGEQGKLSETHVIKREISKSSGTETQQLRERSLINPMYLWHCMAVDEEKNSLR